MRSLFTGDGDARIMEAIYNNVIHRVTLYRPVGSHSPNKDLASSGLGTTVAQILENSFANRLQQWQHGFRPGLSMADAHTFPPPIQLFQAKSRHFACAQTIGTKHQHDRIVAQPLRAAVLARGFEEHLDFSDTYRRWNTLIGIEPRTDQTRGEIKGDPAVLVQVAQEASQSVHQILKGAAPQLRCP